MEKNQTFINFLKNLQKSTNLFVKARKTEVHSAQRSNINCLFLSDNYIYFRFHGLGESPPAQAPTGQLTGLFHGNLFSYVAHSVCLQNFTFFSKSNLCWVIKTQTRKHVRVEYMRRLSLLTLSKQIGLSSFNTVCIMLMYSTVCSSSDAMSFFIVSERGSKVRS